MLDLLERALGLVERVIDALIALLVVGLVLIVASQLIDRHVVTLPVAAPDQYARVLLVWLTFTGFAVAVKNGANVRVDLIDSRLPEALRRALEVAFDAVMLVLTVLIGWHGWPLLVVGLDQERLGTVLTEAWPTASLLVSCFLLAAFLVLRLLLALSGRVVPRAAHLE
ncbi:MAG: TRAP transporter small permease [Burkholderiales bacterium]